MNMSTIIRDSHNRKRPRVTSVSITEGPVWKGLLAFFFPILLGTFFQQLYNTTDAVIVGRFVGKEALAAVGGGTAVYVNLLVGFFVGLASGATVVIAQFYGARDQRETSRAVHTAAALALLAGAVMTAAGQAASPFAMRAIGTPDELFQASVIYLRIFFCGMIPMFFYNMGAGILRAAGDSKSPFYMLIAGCISNIILDLLFVAVLRMEVAGAAWATVCSQALSAVLIFIVLHRVKDSYRLTIRELRLTPHLLRKIIGIGFPAGIQSVLYTVSNLIIQTHINAFGTDTIAAWAAFGRMDAIFWMTSSSFGVALTSFCGQNYGAKLYDRLRRAANDGIKMAAGAAIVLTLLFYVTGIYIYKLFTSDTQVIAIGMQILCFLAPFWITYEPIEVYSGVIRSSGASLVPMIITSTGVCMLRLLWLFIAVPLHPTMRMVLACYPVTWTVTSTMFIIYYLSGKWSNAAH